MKQRLIVVTAVTLLVSLSFACGSTTSTNNAGSGGANNSTTAAKSAPPATANAPAARKAEFSTTAEAIYQESKANKNAMDKYKGKVVEISGKFAGTSGSDSSLAVRYETSGTAIQFLCRLGEGAVATVAKYEKGQDIKMTGIGDSFVSIDGLGFKDCQPVQ